MILTQFTVRSFRNLAALDLEFPAGGVVILGENGQGKTSLLEAIYYLVLFRSLRGAADRELVRFGDAGFFVAGTTGARVTAGYELSGRRKKVTVDGVEADRLSSALGRVLAVVLSPADRSLVSGAPSQRRRYLDVLLSLTVSGYLESLSAMRSALKQRNSALRRGQADQARLFDRPFAEAARSVTGTRTEWVREHGGRFNEICSALGEQTEARMMYHGQSDRDLEQRLAVALPRDLERGTTTLGPHRDELRLTLGGKETRHFGSGGQQRSAAIALRLIEAETIRTATGNPPIALFDDVFAELDGRRQARLLGLIQEALPGQAVITAPRDSEVPPALLDRPRWQIAEGRIDSR